MTHDIEHVLANFRQATANVYARKVENFALTYERRDLAGMDVRVPPLTLHDYSVDGTKLIITLIEIRLDAVRRLAKHHAWTLALPIDQYTVELEGALLAERRRLDEDDAALVQCDCCGRMFPSDEMSFIRHDHPNSNAPCDTTACPQCQGLGETPQD